MFVKEVDKTSAKSMLEFLKNHFRYYTMNSWNRSTSYANKVKIHSLGLTEAQSTVAYDLLDVPEVFESISDIIRAWDEEQGHLWQAGFNGRSGGYLVLYKGFKEDGRIACYPGRGVDFAEGYEGVKAEDIPLSDLVSGVEVVESFDRLCDCVRDEFISYCDQYTVEDEVIQVPKKIKVLKERS